MTESASQETIEERFRIKRPPTLLSQVGSGAPVSFSRLKTKTSNHGLIRNIPAEDAFVFQILLAPLACMEVREGRKCQRLSGGAPGDTILFDLSTDPLTRLDTPFDTFRFYVSSQSLESVARDHGARRLSGLRSPEFGKSDPILYHLSRTMVEAMRVGETSSLFIDQMAITYLSHAIGTYGERSLVEPGSRGGLGHWQLRRVVEFINSNIDGNPSISELAKLCEVSESHFARGFRRSLGETPHQWITKKRVERAKVLLSIRENTLSMIALECGFSDQSHFSRIFSRFEGMRPSEWRRHRRL